MIAGDYHFDERYREEAERDALTTLDEVDRFAIGAIRKDPDGELEGLGFARFARLPDEPEVAEVAVTVVDAVQRPGARLTPAATAGASGICC